MDSMEQRREDIVRFVNENGTISFQMLKKQFDKISEPLPDFILAMKTYKDYFNLFVKKDFEIQKKAEE